MLSWRQKDAVIIKTKYISWFSPKTPEKYARVDCWKQSGLDVYFTLFLNQISFGRQYYYMIMSSFWLTFLTILGLIQKSISVPAHFKSLLEELSGSNLRFSANIVGSAISLFLFVIQRAYLTYKVTLFSNSFFQNAPFFNIKIGQDGTFIYEGFHVEIVAFIAKALNIT